MPENDPLSDQVFHQLLALMRLKRQYELPLLRRELRRLTPERLAEMSGVLRQIQPLMQEGEIEPVQ